MMSPPRAHVLDDEGSSEDLRSHLIAVTERLLAEQGLEGLTTRRIARAANVADGVLYNHFANKNDLILAGLFARASTLIDEFREACPTPGADTLDSNLTSFAVAMLNVQRGLLPLIAGLIGRPELLRRFLAELHSPNIGGPEVILRELNDFLGAELRLGRVSRDSDSHIAAVFLFAITQLQALAAEFRNTDATAARQELTPFISFLTASMTAARAKPTKKRRS
jgi:AcrR family transcriptional regulator